MGEGEGVGRSRGERRTIDGYTREGLLLGKLRGDLGLLALGYGHADPADPRDLHVLHAQEGRYQPARRAVKGPVTRRPRIAGRDRQPIRDNNEPCLGGGGLADGVLLALANLLLLIQLLCQLLCATRSAPSTRR